MKKTSKGAVIAEMKRVYMENGNNVPMTKEWKNFNSHVSLDVIRRVFGKWSLAWPAIGIDIAVPLYQIRDSIIIDMQRAHGEDNSISTIKDLIKASGHSVPTVVKYFDSTSHALAMSRIELNKGVTKEQLLSNFINVYEKVGKYPTTKDIKDNGEYAYSTYMRHFNSLDDIAKQANIDKPEQQQKLSASDLIIELKRLHTELGRTPKVIDLFSNSKYSDSAYRREFGSFSNALKEIGLTPTKRKPTNTISCPVCNNSIGKLVSHMNKNHPKELKKYEKHTLELYKGGLSARRIIARDDIMYNSAKQVGAMVRRYLSKEEISELRISKIKKTLTDDYASGEYDWVNNINSARNTSEEGRKKNSDGLEKAYSSGERKPWNKGLTKDTDARVKQQADKVGESLKTRFSSGEITKKIGPASSAWNENRDEVAKRVRLGLDFGASERRCIKERARYMCQKCNISQEELEEIGQTLECDHIVAISDGGLKDWENNGQALCRSCHQEKTHHPKNSV